jgi:adenylate cyclase
MSGEGEESGETQPPTSAPETVQTPASAAVPQPPQRSGYGPGHPPIEFRFLDELKRRNVGRVAILYLVVCWLILEPVHVIFHMLEVPVWANRLVIILMALGFPAVTIFAWVYEITPEGLKPTAEIPHGQSIRRQTGRRIDRAIIIVLVLALTYFVVDKFWISKHALSVEGEKALNAPATASLPAVISDKSIAVLALTDMSEKRDQEYFADGTAEEIIDLLSKIPGLTVIGRTSSFQFKGKNEDLRTIGTKLNAAYVLEGSVRKSGDQVRITAQLINTRTGAHEWSETYDRYIGDVLKLQDAIAAAVARELQLTVASEYLQSRTTLKDATVYELLLRGRHAFDRFDSDGFAEAATLFQRAIDRDSTSADAAAELALTYEAQGEWGFLAQTAAFEQARRLTATALRLDPTNARAHYVLGFIHTIYDWDWPAAEREFQQAAKLAPGSADGLIGQALVSRTLGRWDDALRQNKAGIAQDPLSPDGFAILTKIQWSRGHFPEAEAAARRVLDIRPTYGQGHFNLGLVLLAHGDREAALREMQQETSDNAQQEGLAIAYHALGRKAESDSALARMLKQQADKDAFGIAEVYAFRGQPDEAMRWLDRAYAQKDVRLYRINIELPLKSLEADPRFKAFLRKMNLPE